MSALPGHDRLADDEAREEARTTEYDTSGPVNAPGRDLIRELIEAVEQDPRSSR